MNERFNELYHLYGKALYRMAYGYLLNTSDAEDVIQKVFIKLYMNKRKLFLPNEDVKKWLFRVCINESKDVLKSPWRKRIARLEDGNTITKIKDDILIDSLKNISFEYRIPLYLYYYEGYNIKEIASILKKSESAIKMRLSRAKEKLKKEMEGTQ